MHQVSKDGPAALAGIKSGDRIATVGETKIVDKDAFAQEFRKYLAGDQIILCLLSTDDTDKICNAVIGASNATLDEIVRLRQIAGLPVYVRGPFHSVADEFPSTDQLNKKEPGTKRTIDPKCPVCNKATPMTQPRSMGVVIDYTGLRNRLQWKDGSVWTREPHDVTGPWYNETGDRKIIEPIGAGAGRKLKVLDDARRELARGEVRQGERDYLLSMKFADGKEANAAVSPEGELLKWADRPAWTRVPCTVAGRWYDEQNQPRQIEAAGDKGEVMMSDDAGKPVGKGKLSWVPRELAASFADSTIASAPLSPDGQVMTASLSY